MGVHENALLWQVYAPLGVAVRSRVGSIRDAQVVTSSVRIRSAGMQYADDWSGLQALGYQHFDVVPNKLFLHTKRTLFAGENEVRFFIDPPAAYERQPDGVVSADPMHVPRWYAVEFECLDWIEEIVADSALPQWTVDTLQAFAAPLQKAFRQSGR